MCDHEMIKFNINVLISYSLEKECISLVSYSCRILQQGCHSFDSPVIMIMNSVLEARGKRRWIYIIL